MESLAVVLKVLTGIALFCAVSLLLLRIYDRIRAALGIPEKPGPYYEKSYEECLAEALPEETRQDAKPLPLYAAKAVRERGGRYWAEGRVKRWRKTEEGLYKGRVEGDGATYDVVVDMEHPRCSYCNCRYAEGMRRVCKHQVALYIAVGPV